MKPQFIFPAILIITIGCGHTGSPDKKERSGTGVTETSAEKKEDVKNVKRIFDIKSAKIEFNYTGGPETGTEILYFDDFGEVAVLVVNKRSKYSVTNQTIIWKDKKSIIINHEKKTVAKSSFRPKSTEPPAIADTDEQTRKNIGYERLVDESIAGKNCEVWFNAKQNVKYWLWKKVDLKEVIGKGYTKEAASVEETSAIPASVLEIPADYKQ